MRSSNSSHDCAAWRRCLCHLVCSGLVLICSLGVASAIDPNRTISQYVHDTWSTDNGFPKGPVYSISQSPDGYLWIGTESGLVRYDGLRFRQMQSGATELPPLTHVLGLVTDRDGTLWAQLRRPTMLRYRDDEFKDVMGALGRARSSVAGMGRAADGSLLLWVLDGEGSAIVLRNGKFETVAAPINFTRSPVLSLTQTKNGDVWVGTRDAGLFQMRGGKTVRIAEGLPDLKVNALAPSADELWVGTDNGVVHWDGSKLNTTGVPASLNGVQALTLAVDRDANLWVGTNSQGLARLNAHGVSWVGDRRSANEAVTALFEDREGSLWTGSANGLERFRDSAFVTYSVPERMPSEDNGPIYADPAGSLWFAPTQGGLWSMRNGSPRPVTDSGLASDVIYSIASGKDGLWVGRQRGGLTVLTPQHGSITYTATQGLAQNSVYSVYQSSDGAIWAGTLSGGVSRLDQGRFTTYTNENGLAANTVVSIAETSGNAMWFGTPQGLSALKNGKWTTYGSRDGLPSENVNCLLRDSSGLLWIGTANGLAFWSEGHLQPATRTSDVLREQILGIADDRKGSLWIATANHVVRVNRDKLLRGGFTASDLREFTIADGLRGTEGVKRSYSVVSGPEGQIWFSMNRGISTVDPGRLTGNSLPAIVRIQTLSADGAPIGLKGPIHVPGGSKRITAEFAGLSLSVPERVRYRYTLEGFEKDWSSPDASREAVYTNLSPGPYRFRVIASNADGVWNPQEADLPFVVDPLVWQTWWFRLAVAMALGLATLGLYRLRLRQLTRQLNLRFEERLAERTRIAQELHDTLLQGFLSVSMQVHVAADGLPADSHVKPTLTRALQRMGQVIEEGRNAVRGLRSSKSISLDLEHAFSLVRQELGQLAKEEVDFRVIVDGPQRPLHPLLRDEVYRIGREALINAFRHSRGSQIEIELKYTSSQLRVRVRDNGSGIDPKIVGAGREGHWGLSGMRERADRIGARFHVFTRASAGTEIELTIPGHLAFQDHSGSRLKWFAGLSRNRKTK